MEKFRKFGQCGNCQAWTPRDEMHAVHVTAFDGNNQEVKFRLRMCKLCFEAETEFFRENEWRNVLKLRDELEREGAQIQDV